MMVTKNFRSRKSRGSQLCKNGSKRLGTTKVHISRVASRYAV